MFLQLHSMPCWASRDVPLLQFQLGSHKTKKKKTLPQLFRLYMMQQLLSSWYLRMLFHLAPMGAAARLFAASPLFGALDDEPRSTSAVLKRHRGFRMRGSAYEANFVQHCLVSHSALRRLLPCRQHCPACKLADF